jgi:hypothetical protein
MNELTSHVQLIALYLLNGALALSYVIWEQLTPIAVGIAFVVLGRRLPGRRSVSPEGCGEWG